jgi:hypothetical protein
LVAVNEPIMQNYKETPDVDFFGLVHHVLEGCHPAASAERRGSNRREYSCHQFIAPYIDGRLPQPSAFRSVRCQDLSPCGFSFLEPSLPECEYLVVALGAVPYIFLSARVVHHVAQESAGEPLFLIGCRFVARIKGVVYGRRLGQE